MKNFWWSQDDIRQKTKISTIRMRKNGGAGTTPDPPRRPPVPCGLNLYLGLSTPGMTKTRAWQEKILNGSKKVSDYLNIDKNVDI